MYIDGAITIYVGHNIDNKARRRGGHNGDGAVIMYISGAVTMCIGQNVDNKAQRRGGHNVYKLDS